MFRIRKVSPAGATIYVYDGEDIIEEVDAAGIVKARYAHGPGIDEPIAMVRGGATYYYYADNLGSITSLMDSTGAIVASYVYDSFGNVTASTGTVENPYRYTAREWDDETGLYYYRARYYDPQVGRFLNEDPIGFDGGINFYAYVRNSPVNATDPSGLRTQVCCRGLAGLKGYVTPNQHCFIVVSRNTRINKGRNTVIGLERRGGASYGVLDPADDVKAYYEGARCVDVPDCSSCKEEKMFKNYEDVGPSRSYGMSGPNSNTYVAYQLILAGCGTKFPSVSAPGAGYRKGFPGYEHGFPGGKRIFD